MLLCNLPLDILAMVLQRCVRASDGPTQLLKGNLPLLAVCRLWRRLATPLAYNCVFIQYGEPPERRYGWPTRNFNVEEPAGVAVRTNLDLVAMVGCVHAVKRVEINVHCLANPFPGWREVIQRMRAVASKWRVVDLAVAMHPDYLHFDDSNVNMSKFVDDIVEVGDVLAALMPDVRCLECEGLSRNLLAQLLYGHLAGHYADQLQQINSKHEIAVPLDCRFTRLKSFRISCGLVTDYELPRMASEELVSLSLSTGPANQSWASFSADSDTHAIEFTKLRHLSATYDGIYIENRSAVPHRDGHPWRLHFPSLRNLDISCSADICPLLKYAVLPPCMESISIHMRLTAYGDIANVALPACKCLSLGIASPCGDVPSGFPAINSILESARGSERLQLTTKDIRMQVAPENITCACLTDLSIASPTSVDTMLAFIERLPSLKLLVLHRLKLRGVVADLSVPAADGDIIVEPYHTSLETFNMYCAALGYCPDIAVAVTKYLLLRVPTLVLLNAPNVSKSPILDFIEAYAPRYPHLTAIELLLRERESPSQWM